MSMNLLCWQLICKALHAAHGAAVSSLPFQPLRGMLHVQCMWAVFLLACCRSMRRSAELLQSGAVLCCCTVVLLPVCYNL
jgi:hypothetical protein